MTAGEGCIPLAKAAGKQRGTLMVPATTPGQDIITVLQEMKEEHERNTVNIQALEQRKHEQGCLLADSLESIQIVQDEISEIVEKTNASAGSARQLSEVLEAEQAESAALVLETSRLEDDLAVSTASFEAMQVQSADAYCDVIAGLAELRCAWRKRNRHGHSTFVARLCALSALEAELGSDSHEAIKACRRAEHSSTTRGTQGHQAGPSAFCVPTAS